MKKRLFWKGNVFRNNFEKTLDKTAAFEYNNPRRRGKHLTSTWEHSSAGRASALQAGGHRFEPCCSHHLFGPVVQSVSTPACHAGGRRFESVPGRHLKPVQSFLCTEYASVAQLVEQRTENPRVVGSIPTGGTIRSSFGRSRCGCSSSGRAPPCQGGGSEFEPRHPLQYGTVAKW